MSGDEHVQLDAVGARRLGALTANLLERRGSSGLHTVRPSSVSPRPSSLSPPVARRNQLAMKLGMSDPHRCRLAAPKLPAGDLNDVLIEDMLLGSIIHGALGGRGKPYTRASRFLTGGMRRFGVGLNLGTLLGTAGLAWGAYEHFKDRDPSVMTTVEGGGFPGARSAPPPPPPPIPPPIPRESSSDLATSTTPGPDALRRLVALTIASARADGELGEEEYGKILAAAREHGVEKMVQEELANRRTLQEILVGAMDPTFRAQLYALAFGIVRADASVSSSERKWLRELALALDFDSESAARIEQETANKIDRQNA